MQCEVYVVFGELGSTFRAVWNAAALKCMKLSARVGF